MGDVHGGTVVHHFNSGQIMEELTTQDLTELVDLIATASQIEMDDLLTDFLVAPYPTKRAQDN